VSIVLRRAAVLLCVAGLVTAFTAARAAPAHASALQAPRQGDTAFDPVVATAAYLATVPGDQRARADAYTEGGHWIGLWSTVVTVVVAFLILHLGWSGRIRDRVERLTRWRVFQTFLYAASFLALMTGAALPWWIYAGFIRERRYGLSNQTLPAWLADYAMNFGVELVTVGVATTIFYALVRKVPRGWPLWGAFVGVLFSAIQILVYPVYVAPLFNTYTPLTDERVREPVLALARANGMRVEDVYVVDESRRSRRINAQVSGLFGTQRLSLNDNLLERTSLPEIRHVMAHELGHYVLNHFVEDLLRSIILIAALFLLLQRGFDGAVRRWGNRWSVHGIGDVAGLPLLVLMFTLLTAVGSPVARMLSRMDEAEADLFALNAAREPDGAARVALRLVEYRKLDPGPIEEALFYRHPSPRNRIHAAMVWKAENIQKDEAAAD
jgi:STE24 endopeptidase